MARPRASDMTLLVDGRADDAARSFTDNYYYRPVSLKALNDAMYRSRLSVVEKVRELLEAEKPLHHGTWGTTEQVVHFSSLQSLAAWTEENTLPWLEAAKRARITPTCHDNIHFARSSPDFDPNFNRVNTVPQALALIKRGWSEGRERLAEQMYEFDQTFRREVLRPTWSASHTGQEVDVPSYLHGEPEHMVEYSRGQTNTKAISITVDINVRCSACGRRGHDAAPTPPHWLLFRGMAVAMLVQQLSRAGYAVTLRCITHTFYSARAQTLSWPFQDSGRGSNVPAGEWMNWEMFPGGWRNQPWDNRNGSLNTTDASFIRTVVVDILGPGMPMDLDDIIFALAHEGIIRKLEFGLHEVMNTRAPMGAKPPDKFNRYNNNGRARDNNPSRVGDLPIGVSHLLPLISTVDTGADIYLPSAPVTEDLSQNLPALGEEDKGELVAELYGPNFAYSPEPFDTLPTSAVWAFDALKSVGVRFE